ncbi:long-chain fatty acid--CoA ligase [Streptomyces bohaiensis]|uniref:Long-chain fatty acid--CoA ligase n=1 Tax=Streptomyces bohaiensis TaxID=1431344 RepID=A0ABX1CDM4_9ACTN|nr:long-chain fatty acid--CoA ligase [Streptomyces bohaiensis]NJQ15307.1 long-chain fatty acid--CoA ligase [Streptomyces bohaiensis]
MYSTMQDAPLLVSRLLRHGSTVHSDSQVVTWAGDGARRRSYGETGTRSAQLAHALRDELRIREGDRVATLMWNNAEHLEAYFAVPSMGAVLHTLNLRLPPGQLAWVVNHAADRVVLVDSTLLPLLAPLLPKLATVEHVVVVGEGDTAVLDGCRPAVHDYEALLAGRPTDFPWPEPAETTAAALCYTSGTTGDPKGVVYSHRSIYLHSLHVNTVEAMALSDADLALPVVPMFHVNAWGLPHAAFLGGVNLLMPDRFLQPGPLADMIEAERPSYAAAVPTIWQGLLSELAARPRDISSLRRVTIGGSACPPSLMREFEKRHGVTVEHAWGMTETSPLGSYAHPPRGLTGDDAWPYRVSQGRFPASVEPRLIGPDGTEQPWDGSSAGELEVRGPWIAAAYYGGADAAGPDRPTDRFSPDGWLRTGDVGTITHDGYLTITDRAKDVVKSGGEWISSVELENHLMAHPRVAEAAVVAVPDEVWGERPLAAVVLTPADGAPAAGSGSDHGDLRAFLADRVPRWQLPERWATIDEVPKTSVGKFDKKLLRARHAAGELEIVTLDRLDD